MTNCKNCRNCVYWEKNWTNPYEGYCAARVEVTDCLFQCDEHRTLDESQPVKNPEASVGGMVGHL
jgi:hypothetical protein